MVAFMAHLCINVFSGRRIRRLPPALHNGGRWWIGRADRRDHAVGLPISPKASRSAAAAKHCAARESRWATQIFETRIPSLMRLPIESTAHAGDSAVTALDEVDAALLRARDSEFGAAGAPTDRAGNFGFVFCD